MSIHAVKYFGEVISGNEKSQPRNHIVRRDSYSSLTTTATYVRNEFCYQLALVFILIIGIIETYRELNIN